MCQLEKEFFPFGVHTYSDGRGKRQELKLYPYFLHASCLRSCHLEMCPKGILSFWNWHIFRWGRENEKSWNFIHTFYILPVAFLPSGNVSTPKGLFFLLELTHFQMGGENDKSWNCIHTFYILPVALLPSGNVSTPKWMPFGVDTFSDGRRKRQELKLYPYFLHTSCLRSCHLERCQLQNEFLLQLTHFQMGKGKWEELKLYPYCVHTSCLRSGHLEMCQHFTYFLMHSCHQEMCQLQKDFFPFGVDTFSDGRGEMARVETVSILFTYFVFAFLPSGNVSTPKWIPFGVDTFSDGEGKMTIVETVSILCTYFLFAFRPSGNVSTFYILPDAFLPSGNVSTPKGFFFLLELTHFQMGGENDKSWNCIHTFYILPVCVPVIWKCFKMNSFWSWHICRWEEKRQELKLYPYFLHTSCLRSCHLEMCQLQNEFLLELTHFQMGKGKWQELKLYPYCVHTSCLRSGHLEMC